MSRIASIITEARGISSMAALFVVVPISPTRVTLQYTARFLRQCDEEISSVLAYSKLFDTPRVVACLAYPTPHDQWQTLADQKRIMSRATVRQGLRQVEVALIAVPMSSETDGVSDLLGELLLTNGN
uniref:Uncharacterized protein n=1 Tax=Curvibacter symbiont subsp. Hydra magnipapillata TaxID=667019 RepID=C9YCM8_CURXX|nr:hypothetical protein Csp_C24570 [Curvibacter putative symbiont of Hydra magnipapillata]